MSRNVQILLSIITAVVILYLLAQFLPQDRADSQPESVAIGPTDAWPTPLPSASATPTPTPINTTTPTPTLIPTPTPTPIVINSFEELGTLLTIKVTLQTVVESQRERPFPLSTERIILSAVGNVEAGIDLTQIEDADIVIDGRSVELTIPPADVTRVELLPEETEIFDSTRGWILSEYEGLELVAMEKARKQLENWAIDRVDVLERAEEEAVKQLDSFLRKLGFEAITIHVKEADEANSENR